uniref:DUF5641 domain-containing protein n=1 Tax=Phlebotomus papatasi TaxID=29031 RepID=A0A1B0D835_PHLPP
MNDDHKRRSAINSRSGYKSKATRIRKVITKYEFDSSLLSLCTALPEIEHNLNILPDLRDNIESVQETIIQLTRNDTDREEELAELRTMLDDVDESEAKLLELRKQAIASKPDSESQSVKGMFQFLSARMDEQLLQQEVDRRVSEEMNRAERKAEQEKFEVTLNLLLTSNNSVRLSTPKSKRTGHPSEDDEEDDEELQDTSAKLKGLAVPEFSGDYSEWISFKNLFTSIIDKNSNLSNSRKLHYLNSYLKGEAKSRISHLPISNVNYNVAWNILMTAYDDLMGIANTHIKAFLSTPKMFEPSAEAMRRTHAVVMASVDALDAMNMEQRDIWLIHLILEKLDNESKTLWSRASYKKIPSWSDFTDFLRERYKTMEQVAPSGSQKSTKKQEMKSMSAKQSSTKWSSNLATTISSTPTTTSAVIPCACCGKSNHRTVKCYKFRGLKDAKRFEIVQQAKLCINCLDPNHSVEKCQSSSCKKCEEKHSTWLHYAIHPESPKPEPSTSSNLALIETEINTENIQPSAVSLNCANQTLLPYVLLATAVIQVQNDNGDTLLCRAVLDSGSQANIITEEVCQMLKLSKRKSNCRLEGIGATNTPSPYQVTVNFGPRGFNRWTQTDCIVQEKITGRHPAVKISTSLPIPSKLVMADPQWNQPHQIDILIGGQHYWELVYDQTIHLGSGLPILKRSAFGWLVVGQIAPIPTNSSVTQNCNLTTLESIDATLKRFHEIEDLPSCDRKQEENDLAQKIYSETVSRDSSGRFIVHLPFTDDLAKWTSNVQNLSDEVHQELKEVVPDQPNEGSVSTLGLCWSPEVDHLSYKYSPETDNSNPTMRKVFSIASRIYDPLGLIGPFTVNAKQIMQTLWRLKGPGIREYLMKQSNSFSYIRRTLAWVLRFVYNTRAKGNYLAGPLQPEELQNAEVHLVKFEQEEFLRYDIRVLEGDIQKPLSKPLRNLAPFLDENGVIRVGGRLENADLNRETKNPMILPGGPLAKRIVSLPDWNLEDVSRLNRWQLTQKLYQHITKRWKHEYLLTLQCRTKWDKSAPNVEIGDVVLLIDQATAGVSWPLARVTAIHPGRDGKVRLVTIQTAKGTYKRSVQLLAKLPITSEESEFSA